MRVLKFVSLIGAIVIAAPSRLLPEIAFDEGCTSPPYINRCSDGVCRENCSLSKMPFGTYCTNFSSNYQCHNGSCVSGYTKCQVDTGTTMADRDSCTAAK